MIKSLFTLTAIGTLLVSVSPQNTAAEKEKEKGIKGDGVCAKCELKQTAACQNAIKANIDGKDVVVLMTMNEVAKAFHGNVCKSTVPVVAIGKLSKAGDKMEFTASKIEKQKEVTLTGEGCCAKCALQKTDKCQNAVKVEKDGKTLVYFLDRNKVSNDFHKHVCQGTAKVIVKGTAAEIDGRHEVTASKIDLQ